LGTNEEKWQKIPKNTDYSHRRFGMSYPRSKFLIENMTFHRG